MTLTLYSDLDTLSTVTLTLVLSRCVDNVFPFVVHGKCAGRKLFNLGIWSRVREKLMEQTYPFLRLQHREIAVRWKKYKRKNFRNL